MSEIKLGCHVNDAGYDIGNVVNRSRHAEYGAIFKLTANCSKVL